MTISNVRQNQSHSSELPRYRRHCSGVSLGSMWQINSTFVITMVVNTTICNFTDTPLYFLSIGGKAVNSHTCLIGHNAIYLPTNQTFQIYAMSTFNPTLATTLVTSAAMHGWNVNWIGFYK